jgi:hypothetical protein
VAQGLSGTGFSLCGVGIVRLRCFELPKVKGTQAEAYATGGADEGIGDGLNGAEVDGYSIGREALDQGQFSGRFARPAATGFRSM